MDIMKTAVLILPGVLDISLGITLDVMNTANRLCQLAARPALFDVTLTGTGRRRERSGSGLEVGPLARMSDLQAPDLVLLPGANRATRGELEDWLSTRDVLKAMDRVGGWLEGGAAVGAVLAVKGFADAIKSGPKRSIPGVAMVSDDEIFQGSVKGITGVAGGGFTYVVPSVLSGFSVISGGSVGFQSALKSEIFSLQSVTVEGGLGAELVAAGPVQVMSRMRETSVMGREIKIGAQMGDIVTFAGKINSVMNKGWNPAKQRPTMEVTVKAEKNGKIQIQIDTKKRVFIEPSKVTIEFQGNSIVMTENEVKVVAAKKLSMKCEDMEIEATKSFTVKSPKVDIDASSQAKIHTGGSSIKTSGGAIDMDATTINANKEKLS